MIRDGVVLFVLTIPAVLNLPTDMGAHKRSPLDIRTSFDNLPRLFIPPNLHYKIPIALAPILAPNHVERLQHQLKDTQKNNIEGPDVGHLVHHQLLSSVAHLYPQAMSNIHKTSVHTDIKHLITHDNLKVPVLTHTISHSSSNVTHPLRAVLLPFHTKEALVPIPKPLILLHDTSVIPLQHSNIYLKDPGDHLQSLVSMDRKSRQRNEPITADSDDDSDDATNPIGGFGTGLTFGGHGAGHGFFAYG